MIDLLLPATDSGVLAQVIVVLVLGIVSVITTRHRREMSLLMGGATALLLALMAVRAIQ